MAGRRERIEFQARPSNVPISGQVALGTIPPGSKLRWPGHGSLVYSSFLSGHDEEDPLYRMPADAAREVMLLFRHISGFVEKSGGTLDDVVHVAFYCMDNAWLAMIDQEWKKLFGSRSDRATMHVVNVSPRGLRMERVEAVVTMQIGG